MNQHTSTDVRRPPEHSGISATRRMNLRYRGFLYSHVTVQRSGGLNQFFDRRGITDQMGGTSLRRVQDFGRIDAQIPVHS